jgi:hypothetical protein
MGDADRLGEVVLVVASIGTMRNEMCMAEQALREAEALVTEAAPLRKQAALAAVQAQSELRRGAPALALDRYRRQLELYRRVGDVLGEHIALGNVGAAELEAGNVDAAIERVQQSVDGLRQMNAPFGLELRLSTLAVALAWRGDDVDVIPLAREAFDHQRLLGTTFGPLMAAALQHARRGDAQRATLVAGYAASKLPLREPPALVALPMQQRVRDLALAQHPDAAVEAWLLAGNGLSEEQAAAIAFDGAPCPIDKANACETAATIQSWSAASLPQRLSS